MTSITKTQRWLDLIAFLVSRRMPVAVDEIMEKVPAYALGWTDGDETARASVRRKFERDKDELRELGIPIETVQYRINYGIEEVDGYVLRSSDFYLPYLEIVSGDAVKASPTDEHGPGSPPGPSGRRSSRSSTRIPRFELRDDEARTAMDGLRSVSDLPSSPLAREARSALRKLAFDLGSGLDADQLQGQDQGQDQLQGQGPGAVLFLDPPGAGDLRDRLREVSDALLRRKELSFRYYGIRRDRESDRRVRPYGLLFQHSHWYMIAWDVDRQDMRVFRVGRMNGLRVNPRRARSRDYEIPEHFDLSEWADRPPWALPGQEDEPMEVRVRFEFPCSLWAERNGRGTLLEELEDGATLRSFQVQDANPFLRWLLTLRGDATVVSPPELMERLEELREQVASMHAGPGRRASA